MSKPREPIRVTLRPVAKVPELTYPRGIYYAKIVEFLESTHETVRIESEAPKTAAGGFYSCLTNHPELKGKFLIKQRMNNFYLTKATA